MKAHYRTRNGRIVVEVQSETQKGIFKAIAETQDVFEADDTCGLCGKDDLRFVVRTIEDNDFFELSCLCCGAALHFGQHKKGGTLFAKRTEGDRGWKRYDKRIGHAVAAESPGKARGPC